MTNSAVPTIQSSELKGLRVLFLHPDPKLCEDFEARAEQRLPRLDFYSASSLSAGRDILKRSACQLAIFQDGLDGKDFVFAQLELKNTLPSISMIPLIDVPTINQLSAQRRIGGIHGFGKKVDASSFEDVVSLVLNFARDSFKSTSLKEQLEYGKTLQNFLFARSPGEQQFKVFSQKLIEGLSLNYDWNPQECAKIITAESIYSPDVPSDSYANLLADDKYQLAPYLAQTASWKFAGSKPSGAGGMVITLANYIASEVQRGIGSQEIVSAVFERPHFLLHPSIRTLNKDRLADQLIKSLGQGASKLRAVGDGT